MTIFNIFKHDRAPESAPTAADVITSTQDTDASVAPNPETGLFTAPATAPLGEAAGTLATLTDTPAPAVEVPAQSVTTEQGSVSEVVAVEAVAVTPEVATPFASDQDGTPIAAEVGAIQEFQIPTQETPFTTPDGAVTPPESIAAQEVPEKGQE